jgi:hypothetical protein
MMPRWMRWIVTAAGAVDILLLMILVVAWP